MFSCFVLYHFVLFFLALNGYFVYNIFNRLTLLSSFEYDHRKTKQTNNKNGFSKKQPKITRKTKPGGNVYHIKNFDNVSEKKNETKKKNFFVNSYLWKLPPPKNDTYFNNYHQPTNKMIDIFIYLFHLRKINN